MQVCRLIRRGLVSWNVNPRHLLPSRLGPSRNVRICISANEISSILPENQRVPGSRRSLFDNATPAASAEALTSSRELLDIHKQSVQTAGVDLVRQLLLHIVSLPLTCRLQTNYYTFQTPPCSPNPLPHVLWKPPSLWVVLPFPNDAFVLLHPLLLAIELL